MRLSLSAFIVTMAFLSCNTKATPDSRLSSEQLTGSWKLVSAKTITKKDTVQTYPVTGQEMIKLFNGSHFSFFRHNVKGSSDTAAIFVSGAGTYTLSGNTYQEHLQYCNLREWENHDFSFTLDLRADTLTQRGIEKIDSLGIDQEIIEVYARLR